MDLNKLARVGAMIRIDELTAETDELRAFLREPGDGEGKGRVDGRSLHQDVPSPPAVAHETTRRTMSPEARARIGKRMKQYWRTRKAAEKK